MGHYWILFLPLSSLYILAFHGVLRRNIEHREKNKKNLQYIVLPIFCVLFLREREGGTETQMDLFLSAWKRKIRVALAACCSPPGQWPTEQNRLSRATEHGATKSRQRMWRDSALPRHPPQRAWASVAAWSRQSMHLGGVFAVWPGSGTRQIWMWKQKKGKKNWRVS